MNRFPYQQEPQHVHGDVLAFAVHATDPGVWKKHEKRGQLFLLEVGGEGRTRYQQCEKDDTTDLPATPSDSTRLSAFDDADRKAKKKAGSRQHKVRHDVLPPRPDRQSPEGDPLRRLPRSNCPCSGEEEDVEREEGDDGVELAVKGGGEVGGEELQTEEGVSLSGESWSERKKGEGRAKDESGAHLCSDGDEKEGEDVGARRQQRIRSEQ